MAFPKQDYRSGLPSPSLEDFPGPGTQPKSPALQADSLLLSHQGSPVYFLRGVKWFNYIILLNPSDKEWEYYGSYFIDTEIEPQRSA